MLHSQTWGKGRPVVLVHGFTQTGRSWGRFGAELGRAFMVRAIDAPGHGRSAQVGAGLWDGAELVGRAGGPGAYLGYSMGGRLCLHLALARPELVSALVLVSASAGLDTEGERAARREADETCARRLEADGVEAFVTWWLSRPMWATLPPEAAGAGERLANTAAGLASSLRLAGAGRLEPPLWDRLGELAMPVLVVAGGLDQPYVE
ncbi:MAG: alpha/beta fold hydrolase, partial [Acidimicrobiales bacterium]